MAHFAKQTFARLSVFFCLAASTALAQEIPADYQDVMKTLDRKSDFKAGVLKVNIPRNDLKMHIQGVPTPTTQNASVVVASVHTPRCVVRNRDT